MRSSRPRPAPIRSGGVDAYQAHCDRSHAADDLDGATTARLSGPSSSARARGQFAGGAWLLIKRLATAATLLPIWVAQHPPASAADAPPPGASSCSGCHPAKRFVDTSVPRLAGRDPADLVAAMQGFKSG